MSNPTPAELAELFQQRFQRRAELQTQPQQIDSEPGFVVTDPLRNRFFHIGVREQLLLEALSEPQTLAAALQVTNQKLIADGTEPPLAPAEAVSLIVWFELRQLVTRLGQQPQSCATSEPNPATPHPPQRWNPLGFTLFQFNPDRVLTRLLPYGGWIFHHFFVFLATILGVFAIGKLTSDWHAFQMQSAFILDPSQWLRVGSVWLIAKLLHELGHGLVSKRLGIPIRRAGVGIFLFAPAPFVDVTAAWQLASRWSRMAISAGGIYVELLLAVIAITCWTPGGTSWVDRLCIDVILATGLTTVLFNANPLVRFDGYYLLADALDISNLYEKALREFRQSCARLIGMSNDTAEISIDTPLWLNLYGAGIFVWRYVMLAGFIWGAWVSAGGLGVLAVSGLIVVYQRPWGITNPKRKRGSERIPSLTLRVSVMPRKTIAAATIIFGLVAVWLCSPSFVSAPAVIEYAPFVEVRTTESGFVERVLVETGEWVDAGTVVARLRNDDLQRELDAARATLATATVRARLHLSNSELPQHQKQQSEIDSQQEKVMQLEQSWAALQVRTPHAGRVLSHDLEQLIGRHFSAGDSLLQLGDESSKEILVSIAHLDQAAFGERLGGQVRVYLGGSSPTVFPAKLASIEPRASDQLPHPSLGAQHGGPITVRDRSADTGNKSAADYVSCDARFLAKVELTTAASQQVRAGQRVTVGTSSDSVSWGRRLASWSLHWLQQKSM